MFELFEHTADLGLRASAATLEDLLGEAARGLLAMLLANPDAVQPLQEKEIQIEAVEPALLMFDWLSELLYVFETEKLMLAEFDIRLQAANDQAPFRLTARCRGEPMDETKHQMEHEVKAITYHGLEVIETARGWDAQVIVDI
jgi:SHS2 domain-containing protein